ncbi:hypothetical protein [Bifidobacterium cuniculi]|uniref:hypothetical protein n=1 Tax=Bifidobacterium cuniculi TaxID=1688 RepID=UPI0012E014E6|nr:hypothetical protein [Bifidobacterium cuniculi]
MNNPDITLVKATVISLVSGGLLLLAGLSGIVLIGGFTQWKRVARFELLTSR